MSDCGYDDYLTTKFLDEMKNLEFEHRLYVDPELIEDLPGMSLTELYALYDLYGTIGQLCLLKSEAFNGLGDKTLCIIWSRLSLMIGYNIIQTYRLLKQMVPLEEEREKVETWAKEATTNAICRTIHATIRNSIIDPTNRNKVFSEMDKSLFEMNTYTNATHYISQAVMINSIDIEDIMPFLQFLIRGWSENSKNNSCKKYDWSLVENEKNKLVAYKNSLIIMNHFKTGLNQSTPLLKIMF